MPHLARRVLALAFVLPIIACEPASEPQSLAYPAVDGFYDPPLAADIRRERVQLPGNGAFVEVTEIATKDELTLVARFDRPPEWLTSESEPARSADMIFHPESVRTMGGPVRRRSNAGMVLVQRYSLEDPGASCVAVQSAGPQAGAIGPQAIVLAIRCRYGASSGGTVDLDDLLLRLDLDTS